MAVPDTSRRLSSMLLMWTLGVFLMLPSHNLAGQSSRGARTVQALEAARADANRNLLESIMGLRLEGETTVENLVLASSVTRSSIESFVRGAEIIDEDMDADGTATVRLRLDLDRLAALIGRDMDSGLRRIEAVGRAAMRVPGDQHRDNSVRPLETPPVRGTVGPGGAGLPPREERAEPPQWSTVVTVVGKAAVKSRGDQTGTQARLLAERAATADGYRRLLEYVYGVHVSAETTVEMLCLEDDRIRSRVDGYLRGARVEFTDTDGDMAIAEVSLDLSGMAEVIR